MARNASLYTAKEAKNDEFYTLYEDVEKEVMKYYSVDNDIFRGKIILCPCDDADSSFYKFFDDNFDKFGIKKLFCSRYYKKMSCEIHGKYFVIENTENEKIYYSGELQGDGDFRSKEVKALFSQVDFIITNPPFSLFRSFIKQVMEYGKKFLVIGNMNALTYKEIFPLIKDNKMWVGYGFNLSMIFKTPYPNLLEANRKYVISKGCNPDDGYVKTPAIAWFTNLDIKKRHFPLDLRGNYYKGNEDEYPKYDNYDAINVDRVDDIPCDYEPCWYKCEHAAECEYAQKEGISCAVALCEASCNGEMGVPITFLDKYCPEQFKIVGFFNNYNPQTAAISKGQIYGSPVMVSSTKSLFRGPVINGKAKYFRILLKRITHATK